MPINAHPEYIIAEGKYHQTTNLKEKIEALKVMISLAPSHKGGENLRKQLKTRLKKFQEQLIKSRKTGKRNSEGIKKGEFQVVLIGKANSGKSTLLSKLTNVQTKIAPTKFTTTKPTIGSLKINGINIQIIEIPAIDSEYYDKGLVHTTDLILILIEELKDLEEIKKQINPQAKQIIVFNKIDLVSEKEKRKISATLQSKKYEFILISSIKNQEIDLLKEKIFEKFNKIRVYTKEPGKPTEEAKSRRPVILEENSTIQEIAEKIFKTKDVMSIVKEIKIWGPSSKFSGQIVGMKHKLKDLDIVEFKTK